MTLENKREFARLLAMCDDVEPKEYSLSDDVCNIGRSSSLCDVVIERDTISRLHAKIEKKGTHYILHALGRNPTYIDGHVIEETHILHDGDLIGLSTPDHVLRFVDDDPTMSVIPWRLAYDAKQSVFLFDNHKISLTPSQHRLLLHLYQNAENVCTREACAKATWQDGYLPEFETDNLDKLISSLRKRLAQFAPDENLIETHRGIGYIFHNY